MNRFVAILLVPIFLADPSLAVLRSDHFLPTTNERSLYSQQALGASATGHWHPLIDSARVEMIQDIAADDSVEIELSATRRAFLGAAAGGMGVFLEACRKKASGPEIQISAAMMETPVDPSAKPDAMSSAPRATRSSSAAAPASGR